MKATGIICLMLGSVLSLCMAFPTQSPKNVIYLDDIPPDSSTRAGVIYDTTCIEGETCTLARNSEWVKLLIPSATAARCKENLEMIQLETFGERKISEGKTIKSTQDVGRWILDFSIERVDSNYESLTINLYVPNIKLRDSQIIHVAIHDGETVYQTKDKHWLYVPSNTKLRPTPINHGNIEPGIDNDHNRSLPMSEDSLQQRIKKLESDNDRKNDLIDALLAKNGILGSDVMVIVLVCLVAMFLIIGIGAVCITKKIKLDDSRGPESLQRVPPGTITIFTSKSEPNRINMD